MSDLDAVGEALKKYWKKPGSYELTVHSDIAEDDVISVPLLFRDFGTMNHLEKTALEHCSGKVLDLGAGAGSHTLELQSRQLDVVALDQSAGAVEVMQKRGVQKAVRGTWQNYQATGFDTILMLMNGIGVVGDLDGLTAFLQRAKQWLAPGGKLIFDSSDILFLFEDALDPLIGDGPDYYGHVQYQMRFELACSDWFKWLFIDLELLQKYALKAGYSVELLAEGSHYEYLVKLTLQ